MIVWGGLGNGAALATGARFDPSLDSWKAVSASNAPPARYEHTAVWTGTRMIVWGGSDGANQLSSGSAYDPVTDTWAAIPSSMVGRTQHSAVWTGSAMTIYGGYGDSMGMDEYLPSANVSGGMTYDPATQTWTGVVQIGQPSARANHIAAFLDGKMLVWGGHNGTSMLDNGGLYDPKTLSWMVTNVPAPERRRHHTAVVLDNPPRVVVWGGASEAGFLDSGGIFDPSANGWTMLPVVLSARSLHSAVSTGNSMLLWGGRGASGELGDGAIYLPKK
jgi:N-acetylneuraminic acid mutarotase